MSGYATLTKTSVPRPALRAVPDATTSESSRFDAPADHALLDLVVEQLADRVAAAVLARLEPAAAGVAPEWMDSRAAADYLGLHRDTLRKLAAERAIPAEQDGRGCKLFFRRDDLDEWRHSGGRAAHIASTLARVA
jgi:excisionase family DNA binding protein